MVLSRLQKEKQILSLKEKIQNSNSVVIWNYVNNDANFIAKIKKIVIESNGEDVVYKNRLAKIAFKETGKTEIIKYLDGPSSFLFIYDEENSALRTLNKILKTDKKKDYFKAGYIEEKFFDGKGIQEIAELPGRNELLGQLLSVLQADVRNLAYLLSQIKKDQ